MDVSRPVGMSLLESAEFRTELAARASSLEWKDFKPGDRVRHFEYGDGTVRLASQAKMCIGWDSPTEVRDDYPSAIAHFLHHI